MVSRFLRDRILINTLAYQCVIHISHRYNLSCDRNLISFKTIRISFSVITLMMISANFITKFLEVIIPDIIYTVNYFTPLVVWDFIYSNSSAVSLPGFNKILSVIAIFPISCNALADVMFSIVFLSKPYSG